MGPTMKEDPGIPLLTGANNKNWKFRVKIYLNAAEPSSVLKGDAPAENNASRLKWEQNDRTVKSLLVGFLSNECVEGVREMETAETM